MNILIAPDSFKGSLTARKAAESMEIGVLKAIPQAKTRLIPMADGGEGTMIALIEATQGFFAELEVKDPLGRPIRGHYGVTGDGETAVIELAEASGLDKLAKSELDPLAASTFGTGQFILHALEQGLRRFIICLGGSATNDGGSGILKALGFRFLNEAGNELAPGGLALKNLHAIDDSSVVPSVGEAVFQVACDVNNPLIGRNGASAIFGPQKGATVEMAEQLDDALTVFANCIQEKTGKSVHQIPGAGAAGGTAAGLVAFLDTELKPGIRIVTDTLCLKELLENQSFDFLLTGEGKIDGQTASGKVVAGLSEVAKAHGLPVIALGGAVEGNLGPLHEKGMTAAFSITDGPMPLETAMKSGGQLIARQTEQIFRLIKGLA